MTNAVAVVGLGLLAWIAYQLAALRHEAGQRHRELLNAHERSELDQELVRLCPNIASSLTLSELRQWQAAMIRKHEYYEDRKDLVLANPISDEPASWWEIYAMYDPTYRKQEADTDYPFPAPASDEELGNLRAAREATEAFYAKAKATVLTGPEMQFVAYQAWCDQLMERDGSWGRPSSVTASLIKSRLEHEHERYLKPVMETE